MEAVIEYTNSNVLWIIYKSDYVEFLEEIRYNFCKLSTVFFGGCAK